jgi:hypothetical protein
MTGFFKASAKRNIHAIERWFLFPAMVVVAVALPQILLPLFLAFSFVVLLTAISASHIVILQPVRTGNSARLRPRSPPAD